MALKTGSKGKVGEGMLQRGKQLMTSAGTKTSEGLSKMHLLPRNSAKAEKTMSAVNAGTASKRQIKNYGKAEAKAKSDRRYQQTLSEEQSKVQRINNIGEYAKKRAANKLNQKILGKDKVYSTSDQYVKDLTKRANTKKGKLVPKKDRVTEQEIADRLNRKSQKQVDKATRLYDEQLQKIDQSVTRKLNSVQGSADRMLADLTKNNLSKHYGKTRLYKYMLPAVGLAGALMPSMDGNPEQQQQQEEMDPYRVGDDGQIDYYDGSQYQNLPNGFMTDRDGSTLLHVNGQFYRPDQFIQHADGTVTDKQGNILFKQDIDTGDASIFDYYGQQALGANYSPEQVAAIQQQLGVTVDGLWGQETARAYNLYKQFQGMNSEEQQAFIDNMEKGSYFSQYTTPDGQIDISTSNQGPFKKTISPTDAAQSIVQNAFEQAVDPNYYMNLARQAQQAGATPMIEANPALMRRGGRLIPRHQKGGKLAKKAQSIGANAAKKALPGDIQQLRTDRNLAMRLQKQMAAKGMYKGPIDGKFGVGSLAAYQKMANAGYHRGMGQDWSNTPAVRKKAQPQTRGVLGAVQGVVQKGLNITPEQQKQYLAAQKNKLEDLSWSDVLTGDNTEATGDSDIGGRAVQKIFGTKKDSGWNFLGDLASMFLAPINAVNAINDFRHGNIGSGLMNTFFSLPIIGGIGKGIAMGIKGAGKVAKAIGGASKAVNTINKATKAVNTVGRVATPAAKSTKAARFAVKSRNIGKAVNNNPITKAANTGLNIYSVYGLGQMGKGAYEGYKTNLNAKRDMQRIIQEGRQNGYQDQDVKEMIRGVWNRDSTSDPDGFEKIYSDALNGDTYLGEYFGM